jgi:dCMP deaminase
MTTQRMSNFFMDITHTIAKMSRGRRLQVGAIIVQDDENIIGYGWNGTPRGWDNNCENEIDGKLVTKPEVLHAESNAMAKVMRSTISAKGATMYITHAPCIDCSKIMYQAGITKVVYEHDYRDTSGVDFLRKCGVEICKTETIE